MRNNLPGTILALNRPMRALLTFYKTVAVPLIGITFICALQVLQAQSGYFVVRVFWLKILTSIVIGTYLAIFKAEQFVFYNNLGLSRARLLLLSFLLDFTIWMVAMTVTVTII